MGCAAYVHNNSHQHGKLGPRGKKCIFIRYSELSKGFVFVGEEIDGRVIEFESRDIVFLKKTILRDVRLIKIPSSIKGKIQIMVHLVTQ